MTYKNLISIPLIAAISSMACAETYYWADGSFNAAVFYPNKEASGTPIILNLADGKAVIDRADNIVVNTQYAFNLLTMNFAQWNDTSTVDAIWHMYFASSNSSVTIANMTKTGVGSLRVRTSASATGAKFTVTDTMNLSNGSFANRRRSQLYGSSSVGLAYG